MSTVHRAAQDTTKLRLLGEFRLTDGAGTVVRIGAPRTQSLLAYLALHRDAPQTRRRISFLLWPDSSEAQARNSLRQLLHQLRQSWPQADRFLLADPSTLALGSGIQVDVEAYEQKLRAAEEARLRSDVDGERTALERAAGLYHGELLPGTYEDWVIPVREGLILRHGRMLDGLIGLLEERGDYRTAISHGQDRSRMDPLDERVYRRLMRLHALDADRAGALRVYQTCAAVLERELGVEPEPETRHAYERIVGSDSGSIPEKQDVGVATATVVADGVPLVGRDQEWARAMAAWQTMAQGRAHLLLFSGEAGIGKSRLAEEMAAWAGHHGVRWATTRAYAAEGRLSYAPVTDWLRSPALAASLPRVDPGSLSEIARLLPELLTQRPDLPRPSARMEDWQRHAFYQALVNAVLVIDQPLLLILDDLQWCDADTLEWLHFLLRADRPVRLLIAGTVRPEEVDRKHPLTALAAEMLEAHQLTQIDLGPLGPSDTTRLAALIAGGAISPEDARHIHRETEGNPLFVVETIRAGLLSDPSERGPALAADASGEAVGPDRIPPKVQSVISARLRQLSEPARQLASLAATVGRAFTLEVVEGAGSVDGATLVGGLDELVMRHVVREQGSNGYDFAHDKIREVAYREMSDTQRRYLHRRVAETLERIHAGELDVVAAQVAAHFATAGKADQAIVFYQRAAEVAQRVAADLEAIQLLHRGLTQLASLPQSAERDARELGLQTALIVSLVVTEGYGATEVLTVFARCRQLGQLLGRPPSAQVVRGLALASLAQARFEECHALGDHLMSLAEHSQDAVLRVEAHFVLAVTLQLTGALVPARAQFDLALANYDRARSPIHVRRYSQDPGVVCLIRLALDLWLLGDVDAAALRRAESLKLAEDLGHPFSQAYALTWDGVLASLEGDPDVARARAEAITTLARGQRMPFWQSIGTVLRGWAVAELGAVGPGIDLMRTGMADFQAIGSLFMQPFHLGLLAEQYGRFGNLERGLILIAEALASVERTGERWCEPELHRRKGDLLARSSGDVDAEAAYRRAIDVARYQGAHVPELRSATRLADLWLRQGRTLDVPLLLGPIVAAFGATTRLADLDRARTLLHGLTIP